LETPPQRQPRPPVLVQGNHMVPPIATMQQINLTDIQQSVAAAAQRSATQSVAPPIPPDPAPQFLPFSAPVFRFQLKAQEYLNSHPTVSSPKAYKYAGTTPSPTEKSRITNPPITPTINLVDPNPIRPTKIK